MEDLWYVQNSGIDIDEFSDMVEYKRFLDRFHKEEEIKNSRRLLYGDDEKK